jgi:protein gp37
MSDTTTIEWTDATFNPWSGCTKVSPGCKNCYAANLPPSMRRGAVWGDGNPRIVASDAYWAQPHAWNRKAAKEGRRMRVFCASTADVFEARADLDMHRTRLFRLIEATPRLDWQLLTKRPEYAAQWAGERDAEWASVGVRDWWPSNAWIGTSVENQEQANKRIPDLLRVPAAVRFLSMEPLLGPVDLSAVKDCGGAIQINALTGYWRWSDIEEGNGPAVSWVIVGGESGRGSGIRPMHPQWARDIRDQCARAGVPFLFKQWGEWAPDDASIALVNGPCHPDLNMRRVGKHSAGRHLDGATHDGFPE